MNRNFSIAAIVLFFSSFLVFDYVTDKEIGDSLNASVYYIFLFILILVGAGLALFFGAFVLFAILPLGAIVGSIYFIIEGQYFLALVWFIVLTLPFGFMDDVAKNAKKAKVNAEVSVLRKYYGVLWTKSRDFQTRLTSKEIKVIEEELKKGRKGY